MTLLFRSFVASPRHRVSSFAGRSTLVGFYRCRGWGSTARRSITQKLDDGASDMAHDSFRNNPTGVKFHNVENLYGIYTFGDYVVSIFADWGKS
jgi:hypothetical protein